MTHIKEEPLVLPQLNTEKLFYLEANCGPIISIGDAGKGDLNIYPIIGGYFEGERLKGEVVNLGADWNYLQANKVDVVDTRYLLKTEDGAYISLSTKGWCVMSDEQDDAVERGEHILPEDYYFRQHLFFETGDSRYSWLNSTVAFAVMGVKETGEICYNAYMLK